MIRRPPRSTQSRSSAASDVYKRQVIVCIGDMADMPSLSSYDKGTKGFEGRRYKKDVKAVIDAQEKLFAPIKRMRGYKPKLHMCLGNHEDRITRAINNTPELDGAIGIEDLQYERFGWKITPFKKCVTIKGITFSHYFTSGVAGRPISSVHIGYACLLYTSPSPRDRQKSRMPSSA